MPVDGFNLTPQVVVLTDALALTSNPRRFIDALVAIKRLSGCAALGAGNRGPDNLALLVWLGVDLFDMTRSRQAAASEMLLDRGGPRTPSVELGESASLDAQVDAWRAAVAEVREHLAAGTLRQLVDRKRWWHRRRWSNFVTTTRFVPRWMACLNVTFRASAS